MNTLTKLITLAVMVTLLVSVTASAITYEYDSLNRLIRVQYDDGRNIYYEYDAAGNIIWVGPTDMITGVQEGGDPTFLRLRGAYPNPFSRTSMILFEIRSKQEVKARVYDVRGRLVSTLPTMEMSPGIRQVSWEGSDHRGASVASGVYFVKIETEHAEKSLRVLLVR